MEAIRQTLDDGIVTFMIIVILAMITFAIIGILLASSAKSVVTDEAFKVTSGTSKYSCVISEIDNELSLDCLATK
jgi:hypothetical protein